MRFLTLFWRNICVFLLSQSVAGQAMNTHERLHILHLEDEPDFAELVRSLLEQGGVDAEVTRVGDRLAFTQALDTGKFDLIISDYHLPSFTGLEAMTIAKKKVPHTPFILVSGHDRRAGGDRKFEGRRDRLCASSSSPTGCPPPSSARCRRPANATGCARRNMSWPAAKNISAR